MQTRRFIILFVSFFLLVISGCAEKSKIINLRDCPNPVMVGPIMRIGDTTPPKHNLPTFSEFSGKADSAFSVAHSQSQRVEGSYVVTTSKTETFQGRTDDVAHQIQKATAGRSDLVVVVEEIQAALFQHNSIVGFVIEWISLKGKTVLPDSFKSRSIEK